MTLAKSAPTNFKNLRKVHITPQPQPHQQSQVRLVDTSLSGVKVIARQDLWNDFRNRLMINNYEVRLFTKDIANLLRIMNKFIIKTIKLVDNTIISIRKILRMN